MLLHHFEVQGRYYPSDKVNISVGIAQILSNEQEIGPIEANIITSTSYITEKTDSFFLADFTLNTTLGYSLSKNANVSANLTYFSDRDVPDDYQIKVPEQNLDLSNADSFVKVDLFGRYKIRNGLSMTLKVTNALDQEIYSPPPMIRPNMMRNGRAERSRAGSLIVFSRST